MAIADVLLNIVSVQLVRVRGDSMAPTIKSGRWVVVDRRAFRRRPLRRFEIVRFEDPFRPGAWAVKRIIGLPGEHVKLEAGRLLIEGNEVPQPVNVQLRAQDDREWLLGQDDLIAAGDNRLHSTDSRTYGPIKITALRGRILGVR